MSNDWGPIIGLAIGFMCLLQVLSRIEDQLKQIASSLCKIAYSTESVQQTLYGVSNDTSQLRAKCVPSIRYD